MDVLADVRGRGGGRSVSTTAEGMAFFTYHCSILKNKSEL
jgi:hypothetical protein